MSIDRNVVIKLHKSGESNSEIAKRLKINRTTVWKIIKKFQENGTTLDREGRGRKRTVRTPQLIKKHQGEAATKLSPKLQQLGCCSWFRQIHHAPTVEGRFRS